LDSRGATSSRTAVVDAGTAPLRASRRRNSPGDDQGACLNLLDPFGNTLRIDERTTD
jgi:hypothetical protein